MLSVLNNWNKTPVYKFVMDETGIGYPICGGRVLPLKVFKPKWGWGDDAATSLEYPWVLLAEGVDKNQYKLFAYESDAYAYADTINYFTGGWMWQN